MASDGGPTKRVPLGLISRQGLDSRLLFTANWLSWTSYCRRQPLRAGRPSDGLGPICAQAIAWAALVKDHRPSRRTAPGSWTLGGSRRDAIDSRRASLT